MALITTPGAANADAYGSLDDFKTFCESVGNDISIYPDEDLEAAIRRATAYLDATYGERFIGEAATADQALEWPRAGAYYRKKLLPDDDIPLKVKQASFAAAFLEAEAPGSLSTSFTSTGNILREKVDVLEVQYAENKNATLEDTTPVFSVIEGYLFGLLKTSAKGSPIFGRVARA